MLRGGETACPMLGTARRWRRYGWIFADRRAMQAGFEAISRLSAAWSLGDGEIIGRRGGGFYPCLYFDDAHGACGKVRLPSRARQSVKRLPRSSRKRSPVTRNASMRSTRKWRKSSAVSHQIVSSQTASNTVSPSAPGRRFSRQAGIADLQYRVRPNRFTQDFQMRCIGGGAGPRRHRVGQERPAGRFVDR